MQWTSRDFEKNAGQRLGFLEPVIGELGRIQTGWQHLEPTTTYSRARLG